ncbi:uncharacterized protein LOC115621454 isoform X1 [Scaptodrosophila lebanonensis]|uniref:Uncharacterized protein LOC115621454 isoform X1 n=1 Tax=Drosophila lebanonensis TaxID=7225 RepID=A0A6J2T774_DROLE|nr:uncharacterized protein LOC115621454 isoform X1 [Scaptodrosophila lebanonensis]
MSEFRFFAYTDYAYTTNQTQNILNLPISPFHASAQTEDKQSDIPSGELNIPYTVFEILVAIVSVIGNLMVIIVFRRERKLRRRTNYYIVSLAIADFLVGSLGVPFAILASIGLPHNLHACLFTVSLLVVLCTISIFCLVAVSVDRYWAILYPMAYSRNVRTRTAIIIISLCWVAGTIVGFLPLFGWHAHADHGKCLFVEVMDYNYLVFLYFATIITPAILMLAFYTHIYRVIIKQVRQIVTMNPASDLSRRSSTAQIQVTTTPGRGGTMLRVLGAARKRDVKATQNLSIIVLFFMICWIPLYTINCIKAFCPDCYVHPKLTLFCIILSHLNSAVNPVLYAYHLKDFRAALKNLLLKLMGVDIDQQAEANHRFSLASQHRLQSMDSNVRSTQPRIYVDSPIWLRQQQEALKSSQLLPKCGVVKPCFNNINQTVAAVASVTTDIEREMWNIVEASSGAELGEVSYEFPSGKQDSDGDSSSSQQPPGSQRAPQQAHQERLDSAYSYDNQNFSSSADDENMDDDDDDAVEFEDVFVPQGAVDPAQLRRSLACVMRNKLRSDETDFQVASESALYSCSESQRELPKPSSTHTSPTNGRLLFTGGSNSAHCLPSASVVYTIDCDTNPLSPIHRPKYRKATTLTRNSRMKSRSCSCNSDVAPSDPTVQKNNNNNINNNLSDRPESGQTPPVPSSHLHESFFSPLKSMGSFMLPIGKHSNLFHLFQTHSTSSENSVPSGTGTPTLSATPMPAPLVSNDTSAPAPAPAPAPTPAPATSLIPASSES